MTHDRLADHRNGKEPCYTSGMTRGDASTLRKEPEDDDDEMTDDE